MRYPNALVISADPVTAALVGALVELAEFQVRFPPHAEAARTALRRLRPVLVLADCAREAAGSEAFLGPALMIGARCALFCSDGGTTHDRTRAIAEQHGLAFFVLPDEAERLQQWIASVATAAPGHEVLRGA